VADAGDGRDYSMRTPSALSRAARGAAAAFVTGCAIGLSVDAGAAGRIELPPGPDRDLVYARCQTCHDLQYVVDSAGITGDNWAALIDDMKQYGLRIPGAERERIVRYLAGHLGPGGPPAPTQEAAASAAASTEGAVDGKTVFASTCSACHQAEGGGLARTFPPLANNPDLFIDPLFPVQVALHGIEGPITVNGQPYNGVMPPFDHLSDAQVAAVVNYIRASWGNERLRPSGFADVDAAVVRKARQNPLGAREVRAYRESHR
jgi:mono/diheme cytochrome c family protein